MLIVIFIWKPKKGKNESTLLITRPQTKKKVKEGLPVSNHHQSQENQ
jgi:hypothetical protein